MCINISNNEMDKVNYKLQTKNPPKKKLSCTVLVKDGGLVVFWEMLSGKTCLLMQIDYLHLYKLNL